MPRRNTTTPFTSSRSGIPALKSLLAIPLANGIPRLNNHHVHLVVDVLTNDMQTLPHGNGIGPGKGEMYRVPAAEETPPTGASQSPWRGMRI